jgi:hypothetical protein
MARAEGKKQESVEVSAAVLKPAVVRLLPMQLYSSQRMMTPKEKTSTAGQ